MGDILTISREEKDPKKIADVARQLAERLPATEALAATSVQPARQIISGAGLTGGGNLSADRTLAVGAGTGITVNADDVALANMANSTVKARGTAGTGAPEDIATGDGLALDATSLRTKQQMSITADGSGLKLSGDATTPGNTKYYGTDGSGTKGFNSFPATGGLTVLSYAGSVGTGATYTVTGLGGYKMFAIFLRDVSHNSGANQSFRVELSGNAGSTWGTPLSPNEGALFTGAAGPTGLIFIGNVDQTNNQIVTIGTLIPGATRIDTSARGPIDALRFSFSGGNFDNGSIDIYGLK